MRTVKYDLECLLRVIIGQSSERSAHRQLSSQRCSTTEHVSSVSILQRTISSAYVCTVYVRAPVSNIDELGVGARRPTGVQYDGIYQCRRLAAGATDTEKQSATLVKCPLGRSVGRSVGLYSIAYRAQRAVQTDSQSQRG